jgi:hypothetical protein
MIYIDDIASLLVNQDICHSECRRFVIIRGVNCGERKESRSYLVLQEKSPNRRKLKEMFCELVRGSRTSFATREIDVCKAYWFIWKVRGSRVVLAAREILS